MRYEVRVTEQALQDLADIVSHVDWRSGELRAQHVLKELERALASLATFPSRGSCPDELAAIGPHGFRQLHFKPYRLIYRVVEHTVYVMVIADGRRDMQALLSRRLLEG